MRIVGLEEHFSTAVNGAWEALDGGLDDQTLQASTRGEAVRRLLDLNAQRLESMDHAGIDVQILSLTSPGLQNLAADEAVELQSASKDVVAETVRSHPDRFQGLATLATPSPRDAARKLEGSVTKLGLDSAMVFGRAGHRNLDYPDFEPILQVATALRAPLYLHPHTPQGSLRAAYYSVPGSEIDGAFATHGIGWHYESGVQLLRLIVAGVFDRLPDLQIIVGHWGEVILFYLDRDRSALRRSQPETQAVRVFSEQRLGHPGRHSQPSIFAFGRWRWSEPTGFCSRRTIPSYR